MQHPAALCSEGLWTGLLHWFVKPQPVFYQQHTHRMHWAQQINTAPNRKETPFSVVLVLAGSCERTKWVRLFFVNEEWWNKSVRTRSGSFRSGGGWFPPDSGWFLGCHTDGLSQHPRERAALRGLPWDPVLRGSWLWRGDPARTPLGSSPVPSGWGFQPCPVETTFTFQYNWWDWLCPCPVVFLPRVAVHKCTCFWQILLHFIIEQLLNNLSQALL